ncbi:MAG: hypothetical protein WCA15_04980 [Candidatus Acidiferrales bacterium]
MPIEEVAVLLGHSDIKITQRHYNPWVRARQEQLEAHVQRANAFDPILESMGTQAVRKEEEIKPNLLKIDGKRMVPAVGLEPTT